MSEQQQAVVAPDEEQVMLKALGDPTSAMRELVKNNLFYFIQYFWSEYSEEKFVPNWHIKYICGVLEKAAKDVAAGIPRDKDIIINVPPGTTKTATISIFFPIWCWVNWYWMKFICASYTSGLSLESAEYSREVVRSIKFRTLFPEIDIKEDKDTKSNFRVVYREFVKGKGYVPRQKIGGNRFSTSVGGTVTGYHGHINIVDDPIDPNRAASPAELKAANHWMDNTLPFRKVDKKVTMTILVMQRLHQNDPTGHLLATKPKTIKHICLPGEIKNYAHLVKPKFLRKHYVNQLLDVVRLPWKVLEEYLTIGQYTYGSQIGQDPIPLGGGMFKVDNISVIDYAPDKRDIAETVRYWDKAGTDGGGDFTVGAKLCRLKDRSYVIMDIKRGQWGTDARERIIRQTAEADGDRCKVYVEQEPGSSGKESADETLKNLAGYTAFADRPTGDKALRADPFSVQVNLGNVKMIRAEWNAKLIDEMRNFPNSTFDDQVDATSGAFAKLSKLKRVEVHKR